MSMKLNREYAVRHLCVAALFLAIALWSVWDGAVAYPRENRAWLEGQGLTAAEFAALPPEDRGGREPPHPERKVKGQFYQALALAAVSLVVAARVAREGLRKFDFPPADVASVDYSRWESKRIAVATLKSGCKVVFDAWHFSGVPEFLSATPFPVPVPAPAAGAGTEA